MQGGPASKQLLVALIMEMCHGQEINRICLQLQSAPLTWYAFLLLCLKGLMNSPRGLILYSAFILVLMRPVPILSFLILKVSGPILAHC